jgi:hypothetical protein
MPLVLREGHVLARDVVEHIRQLELDDGCTKQAIEG